MVTSIAAMDYWTLFVDYVFGGFWLAVVGLSFLFFVILGPLGRVSIYTVQWFIVLFVMAMALGYGWVLPIIVINLLTLAYFMFSSKGAVDVR